MNNIELKTASFEVGGDAEVMKVAEAASHAFGGPEDSVDGFHGGVGEAGLHKSQNSLPVGFQGARKFTEWLQAAAVGPSTPPTNLSFSPRESMS